jgi:Zn-dependent protease with chaperone function
MAIQARELPDWDSGPVRYPWTKRVVLALGLLAPLLAVGFVASLLGGGDIGIFAFATLLLGAAFASLWWQTERRMLRSAAARELGDARFANLVEGLALEHGLPVPHLYVSDEGGPNAFVLRRRGPSLVVRKSLLETYTRTEQEAVAAHCLVRLNSGHLFFAHLAALLGRTGSRFAPKVGYEDDTHTVALTRYPPALASAIQKAKPVEDSSGVLWFVAHGASHRSPVERIAALQDL